MGYFAIYWSIFFGCWVAFLYHPYAAGPGVIIGVALICAVISFTFVSHISGRRAVAYGRRYEEGASERNIQYIISDLSLLSEKANSCFQKMPWHLEQSENARDQALRDYAFNAYSPFWSQIETAYYHLEQYRIGLDCIQDVSRVYQTRVESLKQSGIDDLIPEFPIVINSQQIVEVLTGATSHLESIAYEAQRHETFALIWEQRRMTSTLELGFASIEQAIYNMGSKLEQSLREVQEQLVYLDKTISDTANSASMERQVVIGQNYQQLMLQRESNRQARVQAQQVVFRAWRT
jgi:hypothetical protein